MKLNHYRYQCCSLYRNIRRNTKYSQDLILFHVHQFDNTMKRLNKKNIRKRTILLAERLASEFMEAGQLTKKDLIGFLKKVGICHELDFYAYELFFSFLIFFAIKKLYRMENADAVLQLFRDLQVMDFEILMSYACFDEKELLKDNDYAEMSYKSKRFYRENIMKIARKEGKNPSQVINNVTKTAKKEGKHIGFYLKTRTKNIKKWIYFTFIWGSAIIMSIQLYLVSQNLWLSLLSLVPSYVTSKIFANQFMLSFFKPHKFMRLNPNCRTVQDTKICLAIYSVLQNNNDATIQNLEEVYRQNRNVNAIFGLLLDRPESNKKTEKGERENIADLQVKIDALNQKYGKQFFVHVRKRSFNSEQMQYVCKGRKSGAIDELIRSRKIKDSEYLLMLDADIETHEGSILDLVSVACHPLNRPKYDVKRNAVIDGQGILIPKVEYIDSILNSKMHNQFNQFIHGRDIFDGIGLIHISTYKKIIKSSDGISGFNVGDRMRCGYVSAVSFTRQGHQSVTSDLSSEFSRIRDSILYVKQKDVTAIGRYMLMERCLDAVTPALSFIIIILATLFERETFIFFGIAACMPYFAPTYKRLIHQIITGQALSDPNIDGDNSITVLLNSLRRSIWKLLLIPYRALNAIEAIKNGDHFRYKTRDIFAWYPYITGAILNMLLGGYFLFQLQWQSLIFFVWAIVPSMIFMFFHIKFNNVAVRKRRMYPSD